MNRIHIIAFFGIFGLMISIGCGTKKKEKSRQKITMDKLEPKMIEMNRAYVEKEVNQINAYVKRHEWDVTTTGTGLRYMIYKHGDGPEAEPGKWVKIAFTASLINGKEVYDTDSTGLQSFQIGQANVESGLHEALTYMQEGDYAKIVIPSFLAHGLLGDLKKIPPRSTVIYDLKLVEVHE